MPKVFADWRCSQAIMDFLANTEVGRSVPQSPRKNPATDSDTGDKEEEEEEEEDEEEVEEEEEEEEVEEEEGGGEGGEEG